MVTDGIKTIIEGILEDTIHNPQFKGKDDDFKREVMKLLLKGALSIGFSLVSDGPFD